MKSILYSSCTLLSLALVSLVIAGCPPAAPSIAGDWAFTLEGMEQDFGVRINEDGTGMGINIGTGIILAGELRAFVFDNNSVAIQHSNDDDLLNVFIGTVNANGTTMSGTALDGDETSEAWSAVRIQL